MTTIYSSREEALSTGLFFIGYKCKEDREELMEEIDETDPDEVEVTVPGLGSTEGDRVDPEVVETYEIKDPDGKTVKLGTGNFRKRYDLWLGDPEKDFMMRA